MRRAALLLALCAVATVLPVAASHAGFGTDDTYRSHFLARDRDGRAYEVDATVHDAAGGAQLVVEIRRRCGSCRVDAYAKTLEPGELTVRWEGAGVECQCFVATVETKFGGRPLRIDWVWDPEQGGGPSGDGFEWTTVTVNSLLNVSCYGTGTHTSTPDPTFSATPERRAGARKFPDKMPPGFRPEGFRAPGCHAESP